MSKRKLVIFSLNFLLLTGLSSALAPTASADEHCARAGAYPCPKRHGFINIPSPQQSALPDAPTPQNQTPSQGQGQSQSDADHDNDGDDEPGELIFITGNEFSKHHGSDAVKYGVEGNYDFGKYTIDGNFVLIHENEDRKTVVDEARFAGKKKFEIRGHEFSVGPTFWHDRTIDAMTNVGGGEIQTTLPWKVDFSSGAYYGRVGVDEAHGKLLLSWAQIARKFGPVEATVQSFNGKIRGSDDPSALGQGVFHKHEIEGVVDLQEIHATRMIPLAITAAVEKKTVNFGAYGPNSRETIGVVGLEVPVTDIVGKIAHHFRHRDSSSQAAGAR